MKAYLKYIGRHLAAVCVTVAAATLLAAHQCLAATGIPICPLALGLTAEEEQNTILKSLDSISKGLADVKGMSQRLDAVVTDIKLLKETDEERRKGLDEVQQKVLAFSKARNKAATLSSGV